MNTNSFHTLLSRYAELIVRQGMNVQPNQEVLVSGELAHRELMQQVAIQAYQAGAKYVSLELTDPVADLIHFQHATEEGLKFVPNHIGESRNELVDSLGAVVRIEGMEDPSLFQSIDPLRISAVQTARRRARARFYEEGINRWKVQWCVAAGATTGWSKQLFPNLSPEAALAKLWDSIFKIVRVDTPDFLARWQQHDENLHRRSAEINKLGLKTLRFVGGGTDLTVGLSEKAIFGGGTKLGARKQPFTANIPTEEIFSTPDWRVTSGIARVTRPVLVNQRLVRDLVIEFRDGEVINFSASEGADAFAALLQVDQGAKRLGEVALVGTDSPVYQSGIVFQEILFDENACCHIALGSAYKNKLQGGSEMSKEELAQWGCNESDVHVDFMISSEQVDVIATTTAGTEVQLIKNGLWCLGG